jgi:hypothetical protein
LGHVWNVHPYRDARGDRLPGLKPRGSSVGWIVPAIGIPIAALLAVCAMSMRATLAAPAQNSSDQPEVVQAPTTLAVHVAAAAPRVPDPPRPTPRAKKVVAASASAFAAAAVVPMTTEELMEHDRLVHRLKAVPSPTWIVYSGEDAELCMERWDEYPLAVRGGDFECVRAMLAPVVNDRTITKPALRDLEAACEALGDGECRQSVGEYFRALQPSL